MDESMWPEDFWETWLAQFDDAVTPVECPCEGGTEWLADAAITAPRNPGCPSPLW